MKKMTKILSTVAMSSALFLSGYGVSLDQQSPTNVKVSENKADALGAKVLLEKWMYNSFEYRSNYFVNNKRIYVDKTRKSNLAKVRVVYSITSSKKKVFTYYKVVYR
ncbi:hypothetical protein ACMGE9_12305 [Macrococcus sp. EM39E]|uniref:hypothetical protein n=1 Tax=Macrococcus animalis TaxID=3395467 RepID=UPI0039BE9C61